jgi:hypothetical protein
MIMEQGNEKGNLARILVEKGSSDNAATSIWIGGLAALSIKRDIVIEESAVTIV